MEAIDLKKIFDDSVRTQGKQSERDLAAERAEVLSIREHNQRTTTKDEAVPRQRKRRT